ncbi:MAG: hypothetical protein JXR96_07165 [Deltaproteobacteria bacterium]|nr:hypothetical protein [Deltaproteobacteria bacterium]
MSPDRDTPHALSDWLHADPAASGKAGAVDFAVESARPAEALRLALAADDAQRAIGALRLLAASGGNPELPERDLLRLGDLLTRDGLVNEASEIYAHVHAQHPGADAAVESAFKLSALLCGPLQRSEEGLARLDELVHAHPFHRLRESADRILVDLGHTAPPEIELGLLERIADRDKLADRIQTWTGPVGSPRFKRISLAVLSALGLSALVFVSTWFLADRYRDIDQAHPAVLRQPVQTPIEHILPVQFIRGGYKVQLIPRYDYEISALVVSKNEHSALLGGLDDILPADLCLIWGSNVGSGVFRSPDISFYQAGRYCSVTGGCGLPFKLEEFANTHIVAEQEDVAARIEDLIVGDQVRLKGQLVDVRALSKSMLTLSSTEQRMDTSERRTDHGGGACEVIRVTEVELLAPASRLPGVLHSLAGWLALACLVLLACRAALLPWAESSHNRSRKRGSP